MPVGLFSPRQARAARRYELHTLAYVTFDEVNGGIVRDLTHEGIAVQAVTPLRAGQQLQVRFELPHPRLRIETRGEVVWAGFGGQCGIRFLGLTRQTVRRIDEWIFGRLLEEIALHPDQDGTMFPAAIQGIDERTFDLAEEDDGLIISPSPVKVIELPHQTRPPESARESHDAPGIPPPPPAGLDWLSQPLSRRGITWMVDTLAIVAASLLCAVIFLSIARETPKWPVPMAAGAAVVAAVLYWGLFRLFGSASPGARLAQLVGPDSEDDEEAGEARFR